MDEKVQKMLRSDAEVNSDQAAGMSRAKLDSAVRRGIREGKLRARRRSFFYASGGVLAFAAALLLTFAALQPAGNMAGDPTASVQRDWGEFEVFRESAENDTMLTGALNRGEIQPLEAAVEKNGYTVTLHGAVADSRSMILLYSVKNDSANAALLDNAAVEYEEPGYAMGSSYSGDRRVASGETSYEIVSVILNGDIEYSSAAALNLIVTTDTPEALLSSSYKYRTEISLPFEWNPSMLVAKERTLEYDRVLTVDGQQIHVLRTLLTPIGTYVDIAYDDNNAKKIFNVIRPRLSIVHDGRTMELISDSSFSIGELDGGESIHFTGAVPENVDSVTLEIDGISALEREKLKLVIDTETMRVLEAPDDKTGVEPAGPRYGKGVIAIKRTGAHVSGLASNMLLDSVFEDGSGKQHDMESEGHRGGSTGSMNETEAETFSYFDIGEEKLPQPLTFTIQSYPNPILEAARIRID
ncbi:DUF4179 domain-containing protein [Saccharibacillus kuerlensis]|uniref:DUF4179 domain-containing protein n=1 Tax=Saccharibacillus kuerlensis TaxID=459527 RepID=A0ABQ2L4M7_9BACL|nr:DUF4179 domain-containing protein [Saccharibacillus kuerlensis]GGN99858.1 hypothetical protein GCM10010969_20400 [Saccharibacillus kuerlensis]